MQNAEEALAFLQGLRPTQIALGLDRMVDVLGRLDHPECCAPSLHVAGTNGKGSVCAMAERVLRASGRRTGFYSSPHLLRFEERIRIDGEPLGADALVRGVNAVREASMGLALTYFEFGTALAFWAFRDAAVDVQVLETGLGGRLDATNVAAPIAAAITALGLDHTQILGSTLTEIAFEKAGILKPGLTCAVAHSSPETWPILEARAATVGATLWREGREFRLEGDTYLGPGMRLPDLHIGLRGPHQRQNAAVALALLEIAGRALPLAENALREGVAQTRWPGRLQVITPPNAPKGVEVALDGAHNPPAATALAQAVRSLWPGRKLTLIFGVLDDKELGPMLGQLLPLATRTWLVAPQSPRARDPQTYLAQARALSQAVQVSTSASKALAHAVAEAEDGELVLVCGSLYLVAEALAALGERA